MKKYFSIFVLILVLGVSGCKSGTKSNGGEATPTTSDTSDVLKRANDLVKDDKSKDSITPQDPAKPDTLNKSKEVTPKK